MGGRQDAKAILHARFDDELELLVQSDEAAGRKPPDCKRRVTIRRLIALGGWSRLGDERP